MMTALVALAISGSAFGDALILKGGKKIEWKALRDKGDSYEVENLDGVVQAVLKKDVERIEIFDVKTVLTGTTIAFGGKTKTADLLGMINPKRDTLVGVVRNSGQTLTVASEVDVPTILRIPYKLPDEYDLTVILDRKSEIGNFYFGLTSGGRQFMVEFDSDRGSYSQFCGGPGRRGLALEKGKFHAIFIQVRKDTVVVTLDKKEFLVHKGSPASLSSPHQLPNSEVGFFIGTQRIYGNAEHANFSVSRIAVTSQP